MNTGVNVVRFIESPAKCEIRIVYRTWSVYGKLRVEGVRVTAEFDSHRETSPHLRGQGIELHSIAESISGTSRTALAKWLSERLDREVDRMKAQAHVDLALAQEFNHASAV